MHLVPQAQIKPRKMLKQEKKATPVLAGETGCMCGRGCSSTFLCYIPKYVFSLYLWHHISLCHLCVCKKETQAETRYRERENIEREVITDTHRACVSPSSSCLYQS